MLLSLISIEEKLNFRIQILDIFLETNALSNLLVHVLNHGVKAC